MTVWQRGRLAALTVAAALLGSCSVQESTRSGGLVPPTGPAATPAPATPAVETMALGSALEGISVTDADVVAAADAPVPTKAELASVVTVAATGTADTTAGERVSATAAATRVTAAPETTTGARLDTAATPSSEHDPSADAREVLARADPPEGFGEGMLSVDGPAGTHVWPVIIADTPAARQRGLMGVTDFAALGGYAAMAFVFDGDTTGAFWMRETPLRLRITFVAASGTVVSWTDMVPCLPPTPSGDCERYHPAGPYRIAIEHPSGPVYDIALTTARHVEVTGT